MAVAHNDIPEVMCWNLIIACVWWQELPCVSLVTVVYEMLFSLFLQLLIAYVLKGNMARWLGLHFLSDRGIFVQHQEKMGLALVTQDTQFVRISVGSCCCLKSLERLKGPLKAFIRWISHFTPMPKPGAVGENL